MTSICTVLDLKIMPKRMDILEIYLGMLKGLELGMRDACLCCVRFMGYCMKFQQVKGGVQPNGHLQGSPKVPPSNPPKTCHLAHSAKVPEQAVETPPDHRVVAAKVVQHVPAVCLSSMETCKLKWRCEQLVMTSTKSLEQKIVQTQMSDDEGMLTAMLTTVTSDAFGGQVT